MQEIEIKKVSLAELDELRAIGIQTFQETFAEINTAENMKKYLEESFNPDQLSLELGNPDSEFYFAIFDKRVIAYLKLNFGLAQTELQEQNSMEIERIYVLTEFHRKRIGQVLYDHAMQIARHRNLGMVWLGVWEKNEKAIGFYRKNGFVEFDKHIFKLGDDVQTDLMMKLNLG